MRVAYAQLRDLVSRAGSDPIWNPPGPREGATNKRPAAVLILFGMLDAIPAEHEAKNAAVSKDLDLLLLRRASTLRSHPGQVAFPGGRVDPEDDGPIAAALREAREETGLDTSGVEVIGALGELILPYSNHRVTPVIAWWRQPSPVGVVDVAESEAVFRAPVADLIDPANRVTSVIGYDSDTMRGPAWNLSVHDTDYFVWGFTGGIIDRLLSELGWEESWDRSREVRISPPRADGEEVLTREV
ncbi:MAG TPA: CoA pyrophosphatase [Candidatus Microbacterium pullistercoris]|nr:CoA pyrophosphatase [Candidatus Microbacterium pullistercoris]